MASPIELSTATFLGIAVIALAALVTGAVVAVIRLHANALRRAPSGSGLLSWHVTVISVAHLCFVIGTAFGVLNNNLELLETPVELRLGVYALGSVLTLSALVIIGRGQRRRVDRTPRRVTVTSEQDTVVNTGSPSPSEGRHHRPGGDAGNGG